jgi:hypothetical protein
MCSLQPNAIGRLSKMTMRSQQPDDVSRGAPPVSHTRLPRPLNYSCLSRLRMCASFILFRGTCATNVCTRCKFLGGWVHDDCTFHLQSVASPRGISGLSISSPTPRPRTTFARVLMRSDTVRATFLSDATSVHAITVYLRPERYNFLYLLARDIGERICISAAV